MDEKLNIKKAMIMAVAAIILIIIAISSLFLAGLMQDNGISDMVIVPIALIGFFGGNIVALVLLIKSYPALLYADYMKMEQRYDRQELSEIPLPEQHFISQTFLQHKFKHIDEGYYRRKKFSLLKDSISYYVRITEDFEIENAMKREIKRIFNVKRKEKNLCLLLFVYMDEMGEQEKKDIKELWKGQIVIQYAINPNMSVSVITIAVDRQTNTGYYMEGRKFGWISLYSYGCRMVRKLFG